MHPIFRNFNQLIKLVKKRLIVKKNKKIEEQLEKNCNFNHNKSGLLNFVTILNKTYKRKTTKLGLPLFFLEWYDKYIFKKTLKRNPLHKNFSYEKIIIRHQIILMIMCLKLWTMI